MKILDEATIPDNWKRSKTRISSHLNVLFNCETYQIHTKCCIPYSTYLNIYCRRDVWSLPLIDLFLTISSYDINHISIEFASKLLATMQLAATYQNDLISLSLWLFLSLFTWKNVTKCIIWRHLPKIWRLYISKTD